MLRLRTLGGLSIERTDAEAPPSSATPASPRRRLALLAVIAAASTRGVSRDKLLALFWPESDTERARHGLDQTLYALKRDLAAPELLTGRDELSLNPAIVTSDIGDLKAALEQGNREAAVELFTGPFLDGVFVPGSAELERWVETERDQVERDVDRTIESLATEAASRGDHTGAARWWQRLASRNPRKTKVVVALMEQLAASGDRTEALRHAEIYHTLVRDDLAVEPNPLVSALADRIKREPTPPVARAHAAPSAVVLEPSAAGDAPQSIGETPPPAASTDSATTFHSAPTAASRHSGIRRAGAVVAAALSLLAITMAWRLSSSRPVSARAFILVADFENRTHDPIFDRALDAALVAGLQQSTHVNVFPRPGIQQTLRRMGRTPAQVAAGHIDESTAREVAQRQGIAAVVAGTIDRVDSSYLLAARVLDARTGVVLAAESRVAKRRTDVIEAVDDLVRRLRRAIGETPRAVARNDVPLPLATTSSLEALRKFADGNAAVSAGQLRAALTLWQEAVALDSSFALAHAQLGAAFYFANDRPTGDAHFDRALALLDRLTARERLQVRAAAASWRGNREEAIALRHALLAQYPDDPDAWASIGYDLMRLGRSRDAIAAYGRQFERDSGNASQHINVATAYKALGVYDTAIASYRRAFALQPALLVVNNLNHEYGSTLVLAGRISEARAAFDTMLHGSVAQRAHANRSIGLLEMFEGRYGLAADRFRQAVLLSSVRGSELTEARNRLFLAAAHQGKGRRDSARAELRRAHALFRRSYFEPRFLAFLGKALVRGGEHVLAAEVLDTLRGRAQPGNEDDRVDVQLLSAEMALVAGRPDTAVVLLEQAYAVDSSTFVGESLARALAAAGDLAAAARMYETYAGAPREWYGGEAEPLGLVAPLDAAFVLERMGDTVGAVKAYQRMVARWRNPDSDLLALSEARRRLARIGEDAQNVR